MKTNLTVQLVNVTPELAENYLRFNNKNRVPSSSNFDFLVKEMKNNRFLENGESIVFDKYGDLKDGQHRLMAIIKTGKSYNIPIVRGVEPLTMATFDTGKNRSGGDILSINGFKNANKIAALILAINKMGSLKSKNSSLVAGNRRDEKLTNQQVLEYCENNYDWLSKIILDSTSIYSKQTNPKIFTVTQISFMAFVIGNENPNINIYNFLKELTGVSRSPETATNYLYTKIYNSKINKEPLNFFWLLGMTIKAWNFYSDGNPSIKYFKFDISNELPKVNKIINI